MKTEEMMANILWNLFDEEGYDVKTFDEVALMTNNKGVVVKCEDGSEFQISIVKSK